MVARTGKATQVERDVHINKVKAQRREGWKETYREMQVSGRRWRRRKAPGPGCTKHFRPRTPPQLHAAGAVWTHRGRGIATGGGWGEGWREGVAEGGTVSGVANAHPG